MEALLVIFIRDLKKLREEVLSYKSEDDLFSIATGISNSGGNLAMHLTGNLRHFIGAVLGHTGYVRNREEEFSGRFSSDKIVADIEESMAILQKVLGKISPEALDTIYPEIVGGNEIKTELFLYHLLGHLNYHLGQINYHRRLINK
jgi:hypothetical protein